MTLAFNSPFFTDVRHELTVLRSNWGWFIALGVILIVFGFIALGAVLIASLATAIAVGLLLLFGGLAESTGAFFARAWSGFILHLLSGVLSIVVGVLFLRAPGDALLALTLLLASLLMVGGLFRIIAALTQRFATWGWAVVSGIIDLVLGVTIWNQWPESALWVIGMFAGINLIFRGFNWIGLGAWLRSMPVEAPAAWGAA